MARRRVVVIGAGGQARETAWLLREIDREGGSMQLRGFVVSDLGKLGSYDSRELVLGDYGWLFDHRGDFDALALGIGTPASRLRVARDLADFDPSYWPALVHPAVPMDRESCRVGAGVMIAVGAVATVGIVFEDFAMANFGCTIGHEAVIGRCSVVNPGANVSGGVTVGEGVLIGTGAQVLQYLAVGDGATVGAGAVVTRAVRAGATVTGIPARERENGDALGDR